jgi:starch phosphorylase
VPVAHVTNGVHMPTWDSAAADKLWTDACGKERWLGTSSTLEADLRRVSDDKIWELRTVSRKLLVEYARERIGLQIGATGAARDIVARIQSRLDPNVLTLGFARRFASYKRPNLLLHDPDRLIRILRNPQRPAQLILAGKAHPADQAGQALIQEWMRFIRRSDVNPPVIFLADYDMLLAEHLVQGVDVWINTPRRPWEACGTSGMKVLVNGGLNLSELDGWWAEAYTPEVGWALGDGREHGDDPAWDAAEAEALYERLEQEIIPEFYNRNEKNIPAAWVNRIRESMARLTPRFSASRAVCEYTEKHYVPSAAAYNKRAANKGAVGKQIAEWEQSTDRNWGSVRFGDLRIDTGADHHAFTVEIFLNALDPLAVRVEIFANRTNGVDVLREEMKAVDPQTGPAGRRVYYGRVPTTRPVSDYTVRAMANHPEVAVPLEASDILWQR